MLGTIQPGKLQTYIDGTIAGSIEDDGLLPRFQLLVFPDTLGAWHNVDRRPDGEARTRVDAIFAELDLLNPAELGAETDGDIPALRFDPDAQQLFDAWRSGIARSMSAAPIRQASRPSKRTSPPGNATAVISSVRQVSTNSVVHWLYASTERWAAARVASGSVVIASSSVLSPG